MDDSKIGKLDQAVRPIVILAMTAAVIWGFMFEKVTEGAFLPLATLAIGYLFGRASRPTNGNGAPPTPPTP